MTLMLEKTTGHLNFSRLQKEISMPAASWVNDLRGAAIARFEEVGFPSKKTEAWRHTNISEIVKTKFEFADGQTSACRTALAEQFAFAKTRG